MLNLSFQIPFQNLKPLSITYCLPKSGLINFSITILLSEQKMSEISQ